MTWVAITVFHSDVGIWSRDVVFLLYTGMVRIHAVLPVCLWKLFTGIISILLMQGQGRPQNCTCYEIMCFLRHVNRTQFF